MTFPEWQIKYRQVQAQAQRIERLMSERARRVWNQAFHGSPEPYKGQAFEFFIYAHNWQDLPHLTPAQRQACRYVNHIYHARWDASRIAERIIKRMWERIV